VDNALTVGAEKREGLGSKTKNPKHKTL
jgi:hypothetical protein